MAGREGTSRDLLRLMGVGVSCDERMAQGNAAGAGAGELIGVEVTLIHSFGEWAAEFALAGPKGSYVLKDLAAFADRMGTGAFHVYGKRLAFDHVPAAFAPASRAVVDFLQEAVAIRRQVGGAGARKACAAGRVLALAPREAIALLDALDVSPFLVHDEGHLAQRSLRARTVTGAPPVRIGMKHQVERGGFSFSVDDCAAVLSAGERAYAWLGNAFYRCPEGFRTAAAFLQAAYEGEDDELFVAEADMPLFCATVLPALERHLAIDVPESARAYRLVPCEPEFYLDKNVLGVTCRVRARYGSQAIDLFEGGAEEAEAIASLRDAAAEERVRQLVGRYFDVAGDAYLSAVREGEARAASAEARRALDALRAADNIACTPFVPLADEERLGELLFGGLAALKETGAVFTTAAFDKLLFPQAPSISVGLSLSGDLINLEVMAQELSSDELSSLLSSYRKRKRFHRLRSGAFLNMADLDVRHLAQVAHDLGLSPRQLASGAVELPAYQALYLDEQLEGARRDEGFDRLVAAFKGAPPRACAIPVGLRTQLRPYQEEGFRWLNLMADYRFGGILADEMGLGKSVQLIAFLLARRDKARAVGPNLIVCPASLAYNWMAEFRRFAPDLRVVAVAGSKAERAAQRAEVGADVLVTSYDLLRIDAAEFAERGYYCCALDEAQQVKNHATKTARAVRRVSAQCRFALTGTPMENRPSELWSLFDFLMPGLLGSAMCFREEYELGMLAGSGNEEAVERLARRVAPFVLRRRKADVLDDLPDKLEHVVYAHLEGEQARLYAAAEQQLRDHLNEQKRETQANSRRPARKTSAVSRVEVLAELTRLRQICCDPSLLYENYRGGAAKVGVIMDVLSQAASEGRKALVFSQFTSFLSVIARELDAQGVPYYTLTGDTPKKRRLALADAFNADDTPVFLISLKAGGTGLNLTGATVVVHADPWWNAAAQTQAADRAHRIGQTCDVSVYQVIAQGTIEERILRLQGMKGELAGQLLDGASVSLAALSPDELIDLLREG